MAWGLSHRICVIVVGRRSIRGGSRMSVVEEVVVGMEAMEVMEVMEAKV